MIPTAAPDLPDVTELLEVIADTAGELEDHIAAMSASLDALRPVPARGERVGQRARRRGAAVTQAQTPPREESTFRWLWRFGLVRSVLAIGFIGMTLLQSALEVLPDPSEQQWNLAELAFVFYFATAAAQGIAAQTAAQVRDSTERREGGSG